MGSIRQVSNSSMISCEKCAYYTAYADGGCCPFWLLEMCNPKSKKKFTKWD